MGVPVTVEIRRETRPDRAGDAVAWVDEGLRLVRDFEGCLGAGVMRDSKDASVLHVVYRFADEDALVGWERSEPRRRWLDEGSSLVLDARVQRRTGIEGWFDEPQLRRRVDPVTGDQQPVLVRSAPVRWKQAVAIWLGMFPTNLAFSTLVASAPWWGELPLPARAALSVSVLAPFMTFVMMPMVTRVLRHWLRRNPGMIKTQRSLLAALDSQAEQSRIS